MTTLRTGICAALLLAVAPHVTAQSVFLAETELRDTCFNNELTMTLRGTITVQQDGKSVNLPRAAQAKHSYLERFLDIKAGAGERTARFYNVAEASITDNDENYKLVLKANHTQLVAHRLKDQLVVYHCKDALTREEMEVTSHFDSMSVPGLLPRKETKVGDTWTVSRDVIQALTELDAVEKTDVTGKLEKIEGDFAYISFQGLVQGVDMAAPVKLMVKDSTAAFNLKLKKLTQLDWKVSDQRDQGPVSPALAADIHFHLKRMPIDRPQPLSDLALVKVPSGPPSANLTNIAYRNLNRGFEFQFSRDWYVVNQTSDGKLILRLVDGRGEFIAQCAVTPWQKVKTPMKLDEFAKLVRETKGWSQKEGPALDETDKLRSANGYSIFRVTAEGKLSGVDAVRSFYLVATPQGEQVLIDFTMLPAQASKLAARDVEIVQSFQFFAVENGRIEAIPASQTK